MRSTTTLLAAAAALLSFTAASPLERRYQECRAPQQWHVCGDGWAGCCSVSPCKGPAIASGCPDEGATNPPAPSSTTIDTPVPSASASPGPDVDWIEQCKEDDSNCNWKPTFYHIKNYDEEYSMNTTTQLFAWKDEGESKRRDIIAVYKDIPDSVKTCRMSWYKPGQGIFYGTYADGSFNISILATGDKFEEAVDGKINWKNTKGFFENEDRQGVLDLANWGRHIGTQYLNGVDFDCSGKKEIAVHLSLSAQLEGAVIVDQVAELGPFGNDFVQRAGWVLMYDPQVQG